MIIEFFKIFVTLIAIMDPFGGVPMFLSLTKGYTEERMKRSATRAIKVSTIMVVVFLFLGETILSFFGISFPSFQIGGGIILLLLGISYVLDIAFSNHNEHNYEKDITIPLATPLIIGAGVLTTLIILVKEHGYFLVLFASLLALFVFWILMIYSHKIKSGVGEQGLEILSKIMGLLIVAIAVELIISGIKLTFGFVNAIL